MCRVDTTLLHLPSPFREEGARHVKLKSMRRYLPPFLEEGAHHADTLLHLGRRVLRVVKIQSDISPTPPFQEEGTVGRHTYITIKQQARQAKEQRTLLILYYDEIMMGSCVTELPARARWPRWVDVVGDPNTTMRYDTYHTYLNSIVLVFCTW